MSTGGSALMAVDVLRSKGVPEERILFLNLIASPEGAANFSKKYPNLRIVTAFVDEGLNEKKYAYFFAMLSRQYTLLTILQLHRPWTRRLWRSILYPLGDFSLQTPHSLI